MGQYWLPVNLTKREYIDPHKLGTGLKLWEQLANHPGTGAGLLVLLAAQPEARGGGDFDLDMNWHGPERTFPEHNVSPGPMPEEYSKVAKRTIGRWAGDQIVLVGDYAEDGDFPVPGGCPYPSKIWEACHDGQFRDISDDVARVIAHELNGGYIGTRSRYWIESAAIVKALAGKTPEEQERWLFSPHPDLDGKRPFDFLGTEGEEKLMQVLPK